MTERQTRAFRQFVAAGYSKGGAAALVGNASQESGVNLVSGYQTRTDHGSQGIFQWRLERLDALIEFCKERSLHSGTLAAQVKFTIYELGKHYPHLDSELRRGGDVADLTSAVCWQYERPAKSAAALDRRIKYAKQVLTAAQVETNAKGGAIVAAGSASGAIVTYLQQGPGVWSLVFTIAAIAIAIVVAAATMPGKDKDLPIEKRQKLETTAEELKEAIEDFNRAAVRLDAAIAAEAAEAEAKQMERNKLLALIPARAVAQPARG
jgi:Phage tail lysozyme